MREGGAVVTDDEHVYHRAEQYADHGHDHVGTDRGLEGHPILGANYRVSELQAAVLLPQLESLAAHNNRQRLSVERLRSQLDTCHALTPVAQPTDGDQASYYKFAWLYTREPAETEGSPTREQLAAALRAEGIAIDPGFRGFVRRSSRRCRKVGELPHSAAAVEGTVLLHHPVLLRDDIIDKVATGIKKVLSALPDRPPPERSANEVLADE